MYLYLLPACSVIKSSTHFIYEIVIFAFKGEETEVHKVAVTHP